MTQLKLASPTSLTSPKRSLEQHWKQNLLPSLMRALPAGCSVFH
jgi:hypothetical protein